MLLGRELAPPSADFVTRTYVNIFKSHYRNSRQKITGFYKTHSLSTYWGHLKGKHGILLPTLTAHKHIQHMRTSWDYKIAVIGLGYAALPLALAFANQMVKVVGLDTNKNKIEQL
jgi:hypothetical protein